VTPDRCRLDFSDPSCSFGESVSKGTRRASKIAAKRARSEIAGAIERSFAEDGSSERETKPGDGSHFCAELP